MICVCCAAAPGPDDALQAPAAPQHELMVQEDCRDWAEEQMAQGAGPHTAARDDAAARLRAFEDISAGDCRLPMPPLPLWALGGFHEVKPLPYHPSCTSVLRCSRHACIGSIRPFSRQPVRRTAMTWVTMQMWRSGPG